VTSPDPEPRALVVAPDRTPAPLANLAQRTLATIQAAESALVPRQLIVGADGSAIFGTIGAALAVAVDGDVILVRPGEYRESLVIDKSVTIQGHGPRERIVVRPLTDYEPCIRIEGGEPHLLAITIDSTEFDDDEADEAGEDDWLSDFGGPGANAHLLIVAGSPTIEGVDIRGPGGLAISARGTLATVRHCRISGSNCGIYVSEGATPRIVGNEVWDNAKAAIQIEDSGTNPLIRLNRLHDGREAGILIFKGASPRIEQNEVWGTRDGIGVTGADTDPVVLSNRVHDNHRAGITIGMGASPRVEDNDVWGNDQAGIGIYGTETGSSFLALIFDSIASSRSGTDPLVRANRIHDGQGVGIFIAMGASPRIEDNEIWGNARAGIVSSDAGTDPIICGNRVHDGQTVGIDVSTGASPLIEDNEIWGNAVHGLYVSGTNTSPVITGNTVRDGLGHGVHVRDGATPTIHGNTFTGYSIPIEVDDDAAPTIGPNRTNG
jgi:parallel beta-helix repeat protein